MYSYNTDPTNDVGAPYILMDYIDGTVATELRVAKNCDVGLFGTPDQETVDVTLAHRVSMIQLKNLTIIISDIGFGSRKCGNYSYRSSSKVYFRKFDLA